MSKKVKQFYEFGPFRLDIQERLLSREGQPLPLPSKVFDTLLLLIERRGRVVEKNEMLNLLWPNRFVEETNLTQNIFTLRKALGKDSEEIQYIETVPRRGYRFVVPVKEVVEEVPGAVGEEPGGEEPSAALPPAPNEALISLAVLPLVSDSDDPDVEYLTVGITESIINSLSRLPRVRVIARSLVFAYQGREVDPQKAARELGAEAILVGRVLLMGGSLVIRAELVDAVNGWQIWGEQYARQLSDILPLQNEVATSISEKLLLKLTEDERGRLGKHHTENPEAYQLYLKGRYHFNKRTSEGCSRAIEAFKEAIQFDPNYALAYSDLADSYVTYDFYGILFPWEIGLKAKEAAVQALAIDATLAEAHHSLACVKMVFERDWAGAERSFQRAIELNPAYAPARNWYSHFLMAMGRIEESFEQSQIALKLDPLDDNINQFLGWHLVHARQFDRAIVQLEKTLAINPEFFLARVMLGMAYVQKSDFQRGIEEFEKAGAIEQPALLRAFFAYAYAMAGRREEALALLEELKELSKRVYVPHHAVAQIYIAMNEKDDAFEWLDKAYAAGNQWLQWCKVAPEFDSLRADPRFTELMQRLNLKPT